MSKSDKIEKTFDLRTLEYQLTRGIISQKEYDKYLNELPDDTGNFEEIVIEEEPTEDSPDEDIEEDATAIES